MTADHLSWLRPLWLSGIAPLQVGPHGTRGDLEAMRGEGLVRHVAGGVYLPADLADVPQLRRRALSLLVARGGVAGLLAAAWGHGLAVDPEPVDVLLRHTGNPPPPVDGVRYREMQLAPADVEQRDGLRFTTAARTAADVARRGDEPCAETVVGAFLAAGVTASQVLDALDRSRRYPGAPRARELVLRLSRSGVP